MKCKYPGCTGIHDNNRYSELCPRSLQVKRARDRKYYASAKGIVNRARKHAAGAAIALESAEAVIQLLAKGEQAWT